LKKLVPVVRALMIPALRLLKSSKISSTERVPRPSISLLQWVIVVMGLVRVEIKRKLKTVSFGLGFGWVCVSQRWEWKKDKEKKTTVKRRERDNKTQRSFFFFFLLFLYEVWILFLRDTILCPSLHCNNLNYCDLINGHKDVLIFYFLRFYIEFLDSSEKLRTYLYYWLDALLF
jgi:hypothetical protein